MDDFLKRAYTFFLQSGFAPHQAAALAGNMAWESGGKTTAQGDGGKAFGLAQWHPDRQKNLNAFAATNGFDPKDETTQLAFAVHELGNTESKAGQALRNSRNLIEANNAMQGYLRPSGYTPDNPTGAHGYQGRYDLANRLVNDPAQMQTVLAMPPPQHVGGAGGAAIPASQKTDEQITQEALANRTAGDADLVGYGGSPPPKKPKDPNYGGLLASSAALMAAGEPGAPVGPSWQPQQSPIYRPKVSGLLLDEWRRPFGGLLGG